MQTDALSRVQKRLLVLFAGLLMTLAAAGCATGRSGASPTEQQEAMTAAVPPAFLTGPMSILLTNASDFTARLAVAKTNASAALVSGNVFQQQPWLLFVPMSDDPNLHPGVRFRFLWDVSRNQGYVISEALRGYVRLTAPGQYRIDTAQETRIQMTTSELDGRSCRSEQAIVHAQDGGDAQFLVWRDEATGIAVQTRAVNPGDGTTLQLTQLNPDRLDPNLFVLPVRFVPYSSVEAMVRALFYKPPVLPYSSPQRWDAPTSSSYRSTSRRNR